MLMCSMLECREYIHRIEYRKEWSCANEKSLWAAVVSRACKSHHFTPISLASISRESDHAKLESAISCAREGGEIEFILYSNIQESAYAYPWHLAVSHKLQNPIRAILYTGV